MDMTLLMQNLSLLEVLDLELAHAQEPVNSVKYPLPGTMRAGTSEFLYDAPDDDALEAAKTAILTKLIALVGFPSANAQQLHEGLLQNPESVSWTTESDLLTYDTAMQSWKKSF